MKKSAPITTWGGRSAPQGVWQPIATVPRDGTPVLFANFEEQCLMTGAPHVWTGRYVGETLAECSHAAVNHNGEPDHWMPLPSSPETATYYKIMEAIAAAFAKMRGGKKK